MARAQPAKLGNPHAGRKNHAGRYILDGPQTLSPENMTDLPSFAFTHTDEHFKLRSMPMLSATSTFGSLIGFVFRYAEIFKDPHCVLRFLMWHKDQKSVCAFVLATVNEAQTA